MLRLMTVKRTVRLSLRLKKMYANDHVAPSTVKGSPSDAPSYRNTSQSFRLMRSSSLRQSSCARWENTDPKTGCSVASHGEGGDGRREDTHENTHTRARTHEKTKTHTHERSEAVCLVRPSPAHLALQCTDRRCDEWQRLRWGWQQTRCSLQR